jgi:pimeloyl-ACP methyl ester carboxylesterase
VDGFNIFYREAGAGGAPKLLLLHGFPSAGHMFRDLIPRSGAWRMVWTSAQGFWIDRYGLP